MDVLTESERNSATWRKLSAHLESRLASARLRLEVMISEQESAILRGKIAELKSLLKLGDDEDVIE